MNHPKAQCYTGHHLNAQILSVVPLPLTYIRGAVPACLGSGTVLWVWDLGPFVQRESGASTPLYHCIPCQLIPKKACFLKMQCVSDVYFIFVFSWFLFCGVFFFFFFLFFSFLARRTTLHSGTKRKGIKLTHKKIYYRM